MISLSLSLSLSLHRHLVSSARLKAICGPAISTSYCSSSASSPKWLHRIICFDSSWGTCSGGSRVEPRGAPGKHFPRRSARFEFNISPRIDRLDDVSIELHWRFSSSSQMMQLQKQNEKIWKNIASSKTGCSMTLHSPQLLQTIWHLTYNACFFPMFPALYQAALFSMAKRNPSVAATKPTTRSASWSRDGRFIEESSVSSQACSHTWHLRDRKMIRKT